MVQRAVGEGSARAAVQNGHAWRRAPRLSDPSHLLDRCRSETNSDMAERHGRYDAQRPRGRSWAFVHLAPSLCP